MPAIKTGGVPILASYGDAERLFNNTSPWRDKGRDNERPLDRYNRRKRHFALVRRSDSYACKLYGTTLVEYWKDGRVTLTAHSSMSSNAFANALLPSGVWVRYTQDIDSVRLPAKEPYPEWNQMSTADYAAAFKKWEQGCRLYQFKGSQLDIKREDGKWVVADLSQTQPWADRRIDMKKYNQVLKELGYPEFRAWWNAASKMSGTGEPGWIMGYHADLLATLKAGPEKWTELRWYNSSDVMRLIQDRVKKAYNDSVIIVVKEHEYLHSWNEMDRFRKQAEKFG
jgi:hypothetical protein